MNIVHLTSVHDWRDPRISRKMLPTLAAAGHKVTLVACTSEEDQVVEGWQLRAVSPSGTRAHRVSRVFAAAKSLDTDVYHLHDPELLPLAGRLASKGARVIYDMHENYRAKGLVVGRLIRAVENHFFERVDHVIIAESSYRKFVKGDVSVSEVLNYHRETIRSEGREMVRGDEEVKVVCTGVQSRARGLFTILELAARSRSADRQFHFTVAGICHSEEDRRRAREFIVAHGLEDSVTLVGWEQYVDAGTLSRIREDAHIGLVLMQPHDNYIETIPTKFYEYMAAGLPSIVSAFPRWKEFVDSNGSGIAVDPDDADAVWSHVVDLADDSDRYREMSSRALAAAGRYHWREMEPRLLQVYQSLAE